MHVGSSWHVTLSPRVLIPAGSCRTVAPDNAYSIWRASVPCPPRAATPTMVCCFRDFDRDAGPVGHVFRGIRCLKSGNEPRFRLAERACHWPLVQSSFHDPGPVLEFNDHGGHGHALESRGNSTMSAESFVNALCSRSLRGDASTRSRELQAICIDSAIVSHAAPLADTPQQ